MKFLKKYELFLTNTNINVEVLTTDELYQLKERIYKNKNVALDKKIRFFDYHDLSSWGGPPIHTKTLRYVTAYNNKDILGICKFAYWDLSQKYAVSYLSTNIDYRKQGISKLILEQLFKYFSETYPNETLHWSGYSIEGWKYLRPSMRIVAKKYGVPIIEKAIEHDIDWTDENRELFTKSREEINKEYGTSYYIYK